MWRLPALNLPDSRQTNRQTERKSEEEALLPVVGRIERERELLEEEIMI